MRGQRLQPHRGAHDRFPVRLAAIDFGALRRGRGLHRSRGSGRRSGWLDIEADQRLDHGKHDRVIGPDAAVDEQVAARLKRPEEGRCSRSCEATRDHALEAVELVVGMMRRLVDEDFAVLAVEGGDAEPEFGTRRTAAPPAGPSSTVRARPGRSGRGAYCLTAQPTPSGGQAASAKGGKDSQPRRM